MQPLAFVASENANLFLTALTELSASHLPRHSPNERVSDREKTKERLANWAFIASFNE